MSTIQDILLDATRVLGAALESRTTRLTDSLSEPTAPVELLIELGAPARLRITSASQIEWAARLLHRLNAPAAC